MPNHINIVKKHIRSLADIKAHTIVEAFCSYRGLCTNFEDFPEKIAKDILTAENTHNVFYYPCDVIELEDILSSGDIFHSPVVAAFGQQTIIEYLNEYSLYIAIGGKSKFGDILVIEKPSINIDVNKILIRDDIVRTMSKKIDKIIYDSGKKIDVSRLAVIGRQKVAHNLIKENIENISKYIEEQHRDIELYKKSCNWYKLTKLADASSGAGPDDFGGDGGQPQMEEKKEINYVDYSVRAPFQAGDKVQERQRGWSNTANSVGIVKEIKDNRMTVEWISGKRKDTRTSFSLLDASRLSLKLEKIR